MTLGLAGDTMLGRNVGARLEAGDPEDLFSAEVVALAHEADCFVLNLECAISDRGEPWPDPNKPFFFRAPPTAVEVLTLLEVDCVTMANNHSLDYGVQALEDTLGYLDDAGIAHVGAGVDQAAARAPVRLDVPGHTIGIVGVTDHPAAYGAEVDRPGVAYADLRNKRYTWTLDEIAELDTDVVLVTPHWGPNMVSEPVPHVVTAAQRFVEAGATLVAGHSAHVFHGVRVPIIYDLGDFIDDYATRPDLRNDLGLLFFVTLEGSAVQRIEAVPLALDYCHTRLARGAEAGWITDRFRRACRNLGTTVVTRDGRLIVETCGPEGSG